MNNSSAIATLVFDITKNDPITRRAILRALQEGAAAKVPTPPAPHMIKGSPEAKAHMAAIRPVRTTERKAEPAALPDSVKAARAYTGGDCPFCQSKGKLSTALPLAAHPTRTDVKRQKFTACSHSVNVRA